MRIGTPELNSDGESATYRVPVHFGDQHSTAPDQLVYIVPAAHKDMLTEAVDAAVVGLILPIMQYGGILHVEGRISEQILYGLRGPFQRMMRIYLPWLRPVEIHAPNVYRDNHRPDGVAAGFSAGVDSFCMLYNHFWSEQTLPGFRVNMLLFNNVGSHTRSRDSAETQRVFQMRYARARTIQEHVGLPMIPVDSNLDEFHTDPALPRPFNFVQTHSTRNLSVALLLQRKVGRFFYPSGQFIGDTHIRPDVVTAAADPITMPMLSSETMDARCVDHNYTRAEKTVLTAEIPLSHTMLDVCTQPDQSQNCSRCEKCLRALLTFEIAGKLGSFASVFDLDVYARVRSRYIRSVVLKQYQPYNREIVELARERNFSLTPQVPFLGSSRLWRLGSWGHERLSLVMRRYGSNLGR